MTAQQEETIIDEFLAEMLLPLGHPRLVTDTAKRFGVERQASVILNRLLSEKMVTQVSATHSYYLVTLTTRGIEIARHPGGYKGYLSAQEKARIEKDRQEQEVARATVAAANATVSAARAAWVAAGFSLLSILISLLALWQANK